MQKLVQRKRGRSEEEERKKRKEIAGAVDEHVYR